MSTKLLVAIAIVLAEVMLVFAGGGIETDSRDYYTEIFEMGDNDLGYRALTFVPDGGPNHYTLYTEPVTALPVPPAGGAVLPLTDDDSIQVNLSAGRRVLLYGVAYDAFHVGSNGYITFGIGDTDDTESLVDHFAMPRISGLFNALVPIAEGTVSWRELPHRAVVTYERVPEYGLDNRNTFQIEMFYDGTIRMTYLDMGAQYGLAGLSRGTGLPEDFAESDLTAYEGPVPDWDGDGVPDFLERLEGSDPYGAGTAEDSGNTWPAFAKRDDGAVERVRRMLASLFGTSASPTGPPASSLPEAWVDFHVREAGAGTAEAPFGALGNGVTAVTPGGSVQVLAGETEETLRIDKALRMTAVGGVARIGRSNPWMPPYPAWIFDNVQLCGNNLRRLGIALKLYANNARDYYPLLSLEPGNLAIRVSEGGYWTDDFYNRYVYEPEPLLCPGRVDEDPQPYYTDEHRVYLGYMMVEEQDVLAFADAYKGIVESGEEFPEEIPADTSYGDRLYRLREGVGRFLITDINAPVPYPSSDVPVLMDWPDNHQGAWGGAVLYMDGHVEWRRYPDEFPMTSAVVSALGEIAGYSPPTAWRTPDPDSPYSEQNDPYGFVVECRNQLRFVGMLGAMHASDHQGAWPKLSSEAGRLMLDTGDVDPTYFDTPDALICPGVAPVSPAPYFDDQHYAYLGYMLLNETDVAAFAQGYAAEVAAGGDFSGSLPAATSYLDQVVRVSDTALRFVITDINDPTQFWSARDAIPVMLEWPGNHEGLAGGHVLYMDGDVEWLDYPGPWPMTEQTIATLAGLAQHSAVTEWADPLPIHTPEGDPYGFIERCRSNLGLLALAIHIHMAESREGYLPPLSPEPGKLTMKEEILYPDLLADRSTMQCPGPVVEGSPYDDQCYAYFGYALTSDADVLAFADAYAEQIAAGGDFTGDLPAQATYGDLLYRLRDDYVMRQYLTDAEVDSGARIPVLMEWPGNHEGFTGGHVMYLDGHVEWLEYPGPFPMTETTVSVLGALANWTPATAWNTMEYTLSNDSRHRALCAYNMDYLFTAITHYQDWGAYEYPPLNASPGPLMFEEQTLHPHFLHDFRRLNCPGSPHAADGPNHGDQSYIYTGYVLVTDEDVASFAAAYARTLANGGDFTEQLAAPASYGDGDMLYRMNEWVWRPPGDIGVPMVGGEVEPSEAPLLIEWPDNHGEPWGGNVLFADGHARWLPYPGEFPMTEATMEVFVELAGRPPIGE